MRCVCQTSLYQTLATVDAVKTAGQSKEKEHLEMRSTVTTLNFALFPGKTITPFLGHTCSWYE